LPQVLKETREETRWIMSLGKIKLKIKIKIKTKEEDEWQKCEKILEEFKSCLLEKETSIS